MQNIFRPPHQKVRHWVRHWPVLQFPFDGRITVKAGLLVGEHTTGSPFIEGVLPSLHVHHNRSVARWSVFRVQPSFVRVAHTRVVPRVHPSFQILALVRVSGVGAREDRTCRRRNGICEATRVTLPLFLFIVNIIIVVVVVNVGVWPSIPVPFACTWSLFLLADLMFKYIYVFYCTI